MEKLKAFFGKSRFKNYALWVAIFALGLDLSIYAGFVELTAKAELEMYIQRFLEVLVLLGVVNNPTNPDKYISI